MRYVLAILAALSAAPAAAEECFPLSELYAFLGGAYGEERQAHGIAKTYSIELWTNTTTGSFTLVMVRHGRTGCVIASGHDWQGEKPKPGGS